MRVDRSLVAPFLTYAGFVAAVAAPGAVALDAALGPRPASGLGLSAAFDAPLLLLLPLLVAVPLTLRYRRSGRPLSQLGQFVVALAAAAFFIGVPVTLVLGAVADSTANVADAAGRSGPVPALVVAYAVAAWYVAGDDRPAPTE